jgi:NADP-dependent 3-hydroxy acid dehydrogenase YdfG
MSQGKRYTLNRANAGITAALTRVLATNGYHLTLAGRRVALATYQVAVLACLPTSMIGKF